MASAKTKIALIQDQRGGTTDLSNVTFSIKPDAAGLRKGKSGKIDIFDESVFTTACSHAASSLFPIC
jgi:hypothetical protein